MKVEHGLEVSKRWMRTSSLQRQFSKWRTSPHSNNESGALSDSEFTNGKLSSAGNSMLGLDGGRLGPGSSCSSELCGSNSVVGSQVGRVASWALSFDRLLEDPAGVHTFATFLKQEFSFENIHFWVACERFQKFATSEQQMKIKAKEIFQRHLGSGATEPVNVDSQARQIAQDGLEKPNKNLFVQAQRQIYNLMKFDCYSRFLKCSLYKDCLLKEIGGGSLDFSGDADLDPHMPFDDGEAKIETKKENDEGNEESRWKSLRLWARAKNNKKENVGIRPKNSETRKSNRKKRNEKKNAFAPSVEGNRTSLANSDLAVMQRHTSSRESLSGTNDMSNSNGQSDGCVLCRLTLPDSSTAVVQPKYGESLRSVLESLFERRELHYTAVDAFIDGREKPLQLDADASYFGCQEVRVEERIMFQLCLPNKKSLVVKTPCVANAKDVLRPILLRYGFKIDSIVVLTLYSDKVFDVNGPSRRLDKQSFVVQTRERYSEWGSDLITCRTLVAKRINDQALDLFADLLSGKIQPVWDEFGVCDLDKINSKVETENKTSTELRPPGNSSLPRRNSIHLERDVSKSKQKGKFGTSNNRASVHESVNHRVIAPQGSNDKQPISQPQSAANRLRKPSENEELYKVWERAQRSRLDDQRGTEINFELPDFLKPRPVADIRQDHVRKFPLEARASDPFPKAHQSEQESLQQQQQQSRWTNVIGNSTVSITKNKNNEDNSANDQLPKCCGPFVGESFIPSAQQAEDLFASASGINRVIEFGMHPSACPPRSPPHHISRQTSAVAFPHTNQSSRGISEHTRSLPPLPPFWSATTNYFQGPKSVDETESKRSSACLDESMTPSKIPLPINDPAETSLHVDEANFPPPPPLFDELSTPVSPSDVPPPLPPKPKIIPSRPPFTNRQQSFGSAISTASGSGLGGNVKSSIGSTQPFVQQDFSKGRARRAMYIDGKEPLNISFV